LKEILGILIFIISFSRNADDSILSSQVPKPVFLDSSKAFLIFFKSSLAYNSSTLVPTILSFTNQSKNKQIDESLIGGREDLWMR
jgi:hypothetical protein